MADDADLAAIAEIVTRGAGEPADVARLLEALGAPRKPVQRRAADALAALAGPRAEVRAQLADAARTGPLRRRWGATYALSLLGPVPVDSLPLLVEILGDADGDLRWAAGTLIVGMGPGAPVLDTLRALLGAGNAPQRKMALYCLRDLGAHAADLEEAFRAACDDCDAGVRLAAMAALARSPADSAAATRAIAARLLDADPGVRRAAAATLGRFAAVPPDVVVALTTATADADAVLRRTAGRTLDRLSAPA